MLAFHMYSREVQARQIKGGELVSLTFLSPLSSLDDHRQHCPQVGSHVYFTILILSLGRYFILLKGRGVNRSMLQAI